MSATKVVTLAGLTKYDGEIKSYIADVAAQVAAGLIKMEAVSQLPAVAEAEANTIYLVPNSKQSGSNVKDEYILVNGAFELIGTTQVDVDGKADKVASATNGHFAGLDANGNLTDSGKATADFATAAQGALADTAMQPEDIEAVSDAEIEALFPAA